MSTLKRISKIPLMCCYILVACFIANRNPPVTDKKMFKDYKKIANKGKKGAVEEVQLYHKLICSLKYINLFIIIVYLKVHMPTYKEKKIKKVDFNRLISLT
jgi:hypothetical protein